MHKLRRLREVRVCDLANITYREYIDFTMTCLKRFYATGRPNHIKVAYRNTQSLQYIKSRKVTHHSHTHTVIF